MTWHAHCTQAARFAPHTELNLWPRARRPSGNGPNDHTARCGFVDGRLLRSSGRTCWWGAASCWPGCPVPCFCCIASHPEARTLCPMTVVASHRIPRNRCRVSGAKYPDTILYKAATDLMFSDLMLSGLFSPDSLTRVAPDKSTVAPSYPPPFLMRHVCKTRKKTL